MEPEIVTGDIVRADTEVIVNPWNVNILPWFLLLPGGVSRAILRHAGMRPFNELLLKGPMRPGSAVLTSAGRLPYKGIIHVAGINLLWMATEASIRHSVTSSLKLINRHHFGSAAYPIIGGGIGGMGEEKALEIMLSQFRAEQGDARVSIVRYRRE